MDSLFKVKFNWAVYFGIIVLIRLTWFDLSWYSYFAICITLHQFLILFFSIGYTIPIRYLFGAFMCLQMFVGPVLAYNGLDKYQDEVYKMKIPEADYFAYTIPAVICFILGLHIRSGKLKGEIPNQKEITYFVDHHEDLPYWFIGVGFVSSILSNNFSTNLGFVFYLLGSFKFIGAFMLILGSKQLKVGALILVYGSIILSSLGEAMFHDLLTWLIMLGAVLAIKYKPGINLKAIVATAFILLAVIIQQLKSDYRTVAYSGQGGLDAFEKVYNKNQAKNGIFSTESLGKSNVRINQGFIITNIMRTVPTKVPFENGSELMKILEAAFLPRIIAPNKLNAGDRTIFMKYSGMRIMRGTSMGLSALGDAYINFGLFGGCIFMFFLGFLYSETLNAFEKFSKFYPFLLVFTPLVFYYPIRPDCELQTALGHLVKSCVLIYFIILFWKKDFKHSVLSLKSANSS